MDFILTNDDVYPIMTHTQFFEMKPENTKEEKRIDPIHTLLESLASLNTNEKIWIQMKIVPRTIKENDYFKRGKKLVAKLIYREDRKKDKKEDQKEIIPSEMKLTSREKQIVDAIERKISKKSFEVNIRSIYFGEPKTFDKIKAYLVKSYFSSFALSDQNDIRMLTETRTKLNYFLLKRRLFIRQRRLFRRYVLRETPFFPFLGGTYILNTEEMATIFHPPIALTAASASMSNTNLKHSGAPKNLPT